MPLTDAAPTPEKRKSLFEAVLRYTWIAVIAAAAYVAWVFYSRHERDKAAQARIAEQKRGQAQRLTKQIFGSGDIQFTSFHAANAVLRPGESTELCYGLVNAIRVEIEPPIEQAKPTYYHCVAISPKVTTTYVLKASDAKGNTKSASLTVQVR